MPHPRPRPRPRMTRKRTLLPRGRMVLLLLAYAAGGAILNVAVAWGFSAFKSEIEFEDCLDSKAPVSYWPAGVPTTWPPTQQSWTIWREPGILLATADQFVADPVSGVALEYWHAACMETGWPFRSMRCLRYQHKTRDGQLLEGSPEWMSALPPINEDPEPGFFPPVPIWPGFAINTIFYAAILWLLFAAPRMVGFVRRRLRARRGLCPACAYPIGTSNVCTECGAAVTARG